MNEVQYECVCEDQGIGAGMEACVEAIIQDNGAGDSIADVYRSVYKYTPCGPWISVRLHDGTLVHCDKLHGVKAGEIDAIQVGSIIEGSDACVEADWIKLRGLAPEEAVKQFNAAVQWVNDEATSLWNEANEE